MENTDYIKISKTDLKPVVSELQTILADYHLYYQKLRNFHWNVTGEHFFDLHDKFEEMYSDARLKIDEIAERILTLRFNPESNYSRYLEISRLKECSEEINSRDMISELIMDHAVMIKGMRGIIDTAGKVSDEGTIDLIGAYIRELEKTTWMLDAWLTQSTERTYA